MAQGAALKEVANRGLRRSLSRNTSLGCTDVQIGGAALFYKAMDRRSTPRWRGTAKILDIDETGVTVKFQPQTLQGARYCVRKDVDE